MQAALRAFGDSVTPFHDVYRTLARLCAKGASPPGALLVCVDDLGRAEMEFFSIVARTRRGLPVYAYGEERARHRVESAVALGAIEASEAVILALADDDARHAPPIHHLSVPPPRECAATREGSIPRTVTGKSSLADGSPSEPAESHANPCGSTVPVAPRQHSMTASTTVRVETRLDGEAPASTSGPAFDVEDGHEPAAPSLRLAAAPDEVEYATPDGNDGSDVAMPPRVDDEESDRPARVPWLRYDDRPVRLPPRRVTSPAEEGLAKFGPSVNGSPVARPAAQPAVVPPVMNPSRSLSDLRFEPLLTEEELRALLGDELEELDPRATQRDSGSASP